MHPEHQPAAVWGAVRPNAKRANFLGPGEHWLKHELKRYPLGGVQFGDDLLRVFGHLIERLWSIKVLAAGEEPDFGGFKVFHEMTWENVLALPRRSRDFHVSCPASVFSRCVCLIKAAKVGLGLRLPRASYRAAGKRLQTSQTSQDTVPDSA